MRTFAAGVVIVVGMLIVFPIWAYILYVLLDAAHVDRLVWFLYWIYLPATFVVNWAGKYLAQTIDKGKE